MTPGAIGAMVVGVAGVVVAASGFVLGRRGWPFDTVVLAIHKLVALASLVAIGVFAFSGGGTQMTAVRWVAVVLAAVLGVAGFASGAVVSSAQDAPAWAARGHKVGAWCAIAAILWCAALLIV